MSTWNIATSSEHLKSPFTYFVNSDQNAGTPPVRKNLSLWQKITAVAIGALVAIPTLIFGGVAAFYLVTAYFKNRKISDWNKRHPPSNPAEATSQKVNERVTGNNGPLKNTDKPLAPGGKSPSIPDNLASMGLEQVEDNSVIPTPKLQPLPPPRKDGIKIGLINFQMGLANMCWLNSCLKFIASTDIYDGIFDVNVDKMTFKNIKAEEEKNIKKEILKNLQNQLRAIVTAIRKGEGNTIDSILYYNFVRTVKKFMPNANVGVSPYDSPEFLERLQMAFNYPAKLDLDPNPKVNPHYDKALELYPQTMDHYISPNAGVLKKPNVNLFSPAIVVTIPPDEIDLKRPIDLAQEISRPDDVTVKHDFIMGENVRLAPEDPKNPGQPFTKMKLFINLPENLVINLRRIAWDITGTQVKCQRPVMLGTDGKIELFEFDPNMKTLNDEKNSFQAKPAYKCVYQLEAAIEHLGGAQGGHYICHENPKKGLPRVHNDSYVKILEKYENPVSDWQDGYLFRFRLISKEPIPSNENFVHLTADLNTAAPSA